MFSRRSTRASRTAPLRRASTVAWAATSSTQGERRLSMYVYMYAYMYVYMYVYTIIISIIIIILIIIATYYRLAIHKGLDPCVYMFIYIYIHMCV